jgi:uncharacterized membrane protein
MTTTFVMFGLFGMLIISLVLAWLAYIILILLASLLRRLLIKIGILRIRLSNPNKNSDKTRDKRYKTVNPIKSVIEVYQSFKQWNLRVIRIIGK